MVKRQEHPLKWIFRTVAMVGSVVGIFSVGVWLVETYVPGFVARNNLGTGNVPQIPYERTGWLAGVPSGEMFKTRVGMVKSVSSRFSLGTSMGTVLSDLGDPDRVHGVQDWSKTATKCAPKGAMLALSYEVSRDYSWPPNCLWLFFSADDRYLGKAEIDGAED